MAPSACGIHYGVRGIGLVAYDLSSGLFRTSWVSVHYQSSLPGLGYSGIIPW
ncbi:hypothetical protein BS47DRAFT_1343317 [Hydnum rufescens UP504]|uniref:Uncharacterized protein n=1 Tax=Hydnum rufescens UP504 TaxID=1448309 RepID=A0A9P6AY87_9AGAM|nr:hypothetical protein BS47DRAFT_1343317 [Hydnum rufescens UP504]